MFCSKCGKENLENVKYCKYCGNTMASNNQQTQYQVCIKCNGQGVRRSVIAMVLSVFSSLITIGWILDLTALSMFGMDNTPLVVILFVIMCGILYWGFRKKVCSVCHGSGRLYR